MQRMPVQRMLAPALTRPVASCCFLLLPQRAMRSLTWGALPTRPWVASWRVAALAAAWSTPSRTPCSPSPLWTATGRSRRVQCEWRSAGTSSPSGSLQATASRSPRTSTCVTSLALLRLPPHTRTVASRMGIPSSLCVLHTQVPIGACTQGLGRVRSRRRVLRPVRGHRVRDPEPGPQVHDCWP